MINREKLHDYREKLHDYREEINSYEEKIADISNEILEECSRIAGVIAKCFGESKASFIYFPNAEEGESGTPVISDSNTIGIVLENRSKIGPWWEVDGVIYSEEIPVDFLSMSSDQIKGYVMAQIKSAKNDEEDDQEWQVTFNHLLDVSDDERKHLVRDMTKDDRQSLIKKMQLGRCSQKRLCEELAKASIIRDLLLKDSQA